MKKENEFTQGEDGIEKTKNTFINENIENNLSLKNQKEHTENNFESPGTSKEANKNEIKNSNIESKEINHSKERKIKETESNNLLKKKHKENIQNFICFAIINNEYSKKVKLFFKSKNKIIDATIIENIIPFENINSKKYYIFNKSIVRKLHIYEVELPISTKNIQIIYEYDRCRSNNNRSIILDQTNLISLLILPLNNDHLKKQHIFFDLEDEKEKYSLFNSLLLFFNNKEEISEEICSFLLLSLIKIEENEKINKILSIFEKFKEKNKVSKVLFQDIRNLISVIPQVKKHFVHLLKLNPYILSFIADNLDDYANYIEIIEKNINYLKNIRFYIFPNHLYNQEFNSSEKILHKIITLLKECKDNAILDTFKFKKKFNNYLEILNLEEKKILMNYLKSNSPRDFIINEN